MIVRLLLLLSALFTGLVGGVGGARAAEPVAVQQAAIGCLSAIEALAPATARTIRPVAPPPAAALADPAPVLTLPVVDTIARTGRRRE